MAVPHDPIPLRQLAEIKVEDYLRALRADQEPNIADLLAPEPELPFVRGLLEVLIARGDEARRRFGLPDRYRVSGEHAGGGFGRVLEAVDAETGATVALKVASGYVSPMQRERWMREATIALGIAHPGICKVHHYDVQGDPPFVAMEFERGPTLATWSSDHRPFRTLESVVGLLRLIADLADAAHALHTAGIVHRDIKPANVIRRDDGSAVLVDLGLARSIDADLVVTAPWQVPGTPGFIAPECLLGCAPTYVSDLWSIGATLFACLTGRLLVDGDRESQLDQGRSGRYLRHLEPVARLHRGVHTVLAKAVALHPTDRYGSAADLAADLRRVAAGVAPNALPLGMCRRLLRWTQRNRGATLTLAVLLVLCGVTAISWLSADRALAVAQAERRQLIALADEMLESESLVSDVPGAMQFRQALAKPAVRMLEQLRDASSADGLAIDEFALAQRQYRLAALLVRSHQMVEAKQGIEQCLLAASRSAPSHRREQLLLAIHTLRAEVHGAEGKTQAALDELGAALARFSTPDARSPDLLYLQVVRSHAAMVKLLADVDSRESAWQHLAAAGRYLDAIDDQGTDLWRNEYLAHQEQISALLSSGFRLAEARGVLDRALDDAEGTRAARGMDAAVDRARLLAARARVLSALDRPAEARQAHDGALSIMRELAAQAPRDPVVQSRLAQALVLDCDLAVGSGDLDAATAAIEAAQQCWSAAFGPYPGGDDAIFLQGAIYERRAHIHQKRQHHALARDALRQARVVIEAMPPGDARRPLRLATVLGQLGRSCLLAGDPVEAEALLTESIRLRQELLARHHPSPQSQWRLADVMVRLALTFLDLGRQVAARDLATKAIEMLTPLANDQPDVISVRVSLVEAMLSCARSKRQADPAGAVEELRVAAAACDPTRWSARELLRLHVACHVEMTLIARDAKRSELLREASGAALLWFGRMENTHGSHDALAIYSLLADIEFANRDYVRAVQHGIASVAAADAILTRVGRQPVALFDSAYVRGRLALARVYSSAYPEGAAVMSELAERSREFRTAYPENINRLGRLEDVLSDCLSACVLVPERDRAESLRAATIAMQEELERFALLLGRDPKAVR